MTTYDLIQRIERGKVIPIVKKRESGLEVVTYTGPECVSLEQAISLAMSAYQNQIAPAKQQDAKSSPDKCVGRGLPER